MPQAPDPSATRSATVARALSASGVVILVGLALVCVLADPLPARAVAAALALGLGVRAWSQRGASSARTVEDVEAAERTADLELLLGIADLADAGSDAELLDVAAGALAARLGFSEGRGCILPVDPETLDEAWRGVAGRVEESGRPVHAGDRIAVPVLVDEQPVAALLFLDLSGDARALRLTERVAAQLGRRLQRRRALVEIARARDQAEAASHAQGAFLATMSHEMRTPLNGVLGMATVLRGTELDEAQAECVTTLERSARGLLDQINDLLDFVRLEADDVQADCAPYDPGALLEELGAAHAEDAHAKGLELVVDACPDVPPRVLGDRTRVRQALEQLLRNAVAYTRQGVVVARLSVWQGGDGPVLRFEVADTGCGLGAVTQATLFESFRQGDGSFSRTHGGMGLGLALARRVARLLGGGLGVESVEGRGSTFWLDVPGTAAEGEDGSRALADVSGFAVLVIDDHPQARRVACDRLREAGARAEGVDGGSAALQRLASAADAGQPFDVVLLDHGLGAEAGAELGLAIRTDPRVARTPIVLSETLTERADDALCAQVGFAERLPRPLRTARLRSAVAQAASARREQAAGAPKTPPPAEPPPVGPAAADEAAPSRAARILVAEDNPVNQAVARRLLQRLGHRVDLAKNGREAAEAAGRVSYDLVLMDCQMPEMDGFEATRAIRALPGRAGRLPIVALTANALIGDRQRCLDAGMDDYLAKPIDAEALGAVVDNWLALGVSAWADGESGGPAVPG